MVSRKNCRVEVAQPGMLFCSGERLVADKTRSSAARGKRGMETGRSLARLGANVFRAVLVFVSLVPPHLCPLPWGEEKRYHLHLTFEDRRLRLRVGSFRKPEGDAEAKGCEAGSSPTDPSRQDGPRYVGEAAQDRAKLPAHTRAIDMPFFE